MEKASVRREFNKITDYGEYLTVKFDFWVSFSSDLALTAHCELRTDKTKSIQDMERMADKVFAEMLQATLLKCQDGINSN
jgi:hypothetical protein